MEIIQKLADHLRVAKDKISIISGLSSTKKLRYQIGCTLVIIKHAFYCNYDTFDI
jgi:uncharacterized protein YggU (UPF0235/DUF167 family)